MEGLRDFWQEDVSKPPVAQRAGGIRSVFVDAFFIEFLCAAGARRVRDECATRTRVW